MTVTSKGQVTLPVEYRRAMGIDAGTTLTLVMEDDGTARLRKPRKLADFVGSLAQEDRAPAVAQADIDAAVTDAVGERFDRARRNARR